MVRLVLGEKQGGGLERLAVAAAGFSHLNDPAGAELVNTDVFLVYLALSVQVLSRPWLIS
ncbi:hypothetical protein [Synechococcus sp. RedBA-s]|uniref:hypothetical protein n=1 Tax=Synechococcus sp. RedBA-s TaxID=2823741 RepID=UPI0020CFA49C|nr:hypothetical protein [Synechococcus sp. RedBA-s]